jgi:hypothetical protein
MRVDGHLTHKLFTVAVKRYVREKITEKKCPSTKPLRVGTSAVRVDASSVCHSCRTVRTISGRLADNLPVPYQQDLTILLSFYILCIEFIRPD